MLLFARASRTLPASAGLWRDEHTASRHNGGRPLHSPLSAEWFHFLIAEISVGPHAALFACRKLSPAARKRSLCAAPAVSCPLPPGLHQVGSSKAGIRISSMVPPCQKFPLGAARTHPEPESLGSDPFSPMPPADAARAPILDAGSPINGSPSS